MPDALELTWGSQLAMSFNNWLAATVRGILSKSRWLALPFNTLPDALELSGGALVSA